MGIEAESLDVITACGRISEPNAVAFSSCANLRFLVYIFIASVASYICERSELYVRVGWRISLVYIYIYIYIYIYLYPWVDHLVPRGPRVTRNAQTSDRPV